MHFHFIYMLLKKILSHTVAKGPFQLDPQRMPFDFQA